MSRRATLAALVALAVLAAAAPAASAGWRVPAPPITPGCDPIGTAHCMLPWPNDYFTKPAWSATGRQLNLLPTATPRNKSGVPIDPADYNLSDGFSPGQTIVVKVPGLDTPEAFAQTRPVPVTDLARTYDRRAPVVVINARTPQAPSDLGRDRLERRHPRDDRAADPSRRELARGRALHRRPPQPQGRRREAHRGRPRVQALPRPHLHRLEGVRVAPPAHGVAVRLAAQGRYRPSRPVPRLGLHGLQREVALAPARVDPRPRLRRARRPQPARPQGRGRLAGVHRRQGDRGHARAGAQRLPPRGGHRHRAVLPERGGLHVRIPLRPGP